MGLFKQLTLGLVTLGLVVAAVPVPGRAAPGDLLWMREFGNRFAQHARGIAIDAEGNIYVAGRTNGSLDGKSAGLADAFAAKLDRNGNTIWIRQLGGRGYDWANGVAIGLGGSVVIAGRTDGSLGGTNNGSCDGFIANYTPDGNLLWVRQFGGAGDDWTMGVATDRQGFIFVAGGTPGALTGPVFTPGTPSVPPVAECEAMVPPGPAGWPQPYNAFVMKYDAAGVYRWTRRLGTELGEAVNAITVDSRRNIIVAGSTFGSLAAPVKPVYNDIFFAKYAPSGALHWVRQYGANGSDGAWGISSDRNQNIIIAGDAFSNFAGPSNNASDQAWAAKFSPDGEWTWIKQLATPGYDAARAAATDAAGNIYVAGSTEGNLAATNAGEADAFVAAFSPSGQLLWKKQLGSAGIDLVRGIAVDPSQDSVVVGGWSSFPDPDRGTTSDVLVAKFSLR